MAVLAIGDIDLADLSPAQGFAITGVALGDRAGVAVSTVGDINDDGIDDFIVGASGADPASGIDAGQSYVIYGKAGGLSDIDLSSLTASQGFKISGGAAGDTAGNSVSDAGDVNGDGIADLIVGAVGADPLGRPGAGETYVIYGKTGGPGDINLAALTAAQGFAIAGITDYSHSAATVRSAGDVNGDGIDDIILSAPSSLYQNGTAAERSLCDLWQGRRPGRLRPSHLDRGPGLSIGQRPVDSACQWRWRSQRRWVRRCRRRRRRRRAGPRLRHIRPSGHPGHR